MEIPKNRAKEDNTWLSIVNYPKGKETLNDDTRALWAAKAAGIIFGIIILVGVASVVVPHLK